jgi:hypothetical protein
MELEKVSTRDFRNNISKYLSGNHPVAILRHGQTIGYYFPAQIDQNKLEIETLKLAALRLDNLLQAKGITEDELVEDFQNIRQQERGFKIQ